MELIKLPVDILEKFNPSDEDYPLLKAELLEYLAQAKVEFDKTGKKTFPYYLWVANKNPVVKLACGYIFIFAQRWVLDYLNPVAKGTAKKASEYTEDEVSAQYEQFMKFQELMNK